MLWLSPNDKPKQDNQLLNQQWVVFQSFPSPRWITWQRIKGPRLPGIIFETAIEQKASSALWQVFFYPERCLATLLTRQTWWVYQSSCRWPVTGSIRLHCTSSTKSDLTWIYIHIYIHICTHIYIYIHVYIHIYKYIHVYVYNTSPLA